MDKDGTWWYLHVPKEIRQSLKSFETRGRIQVTATIGESSWDGTLLPRADGSAQISVNKKIRAAERLVLGRTVSVKIRPRAGDA